MPSQSLRGCDKSTRKPRSSGSWRRWREGGGASGRFVGWLVGLGLGWVGLVWVGFGLGLVWVGFGWLVGRLVGWLVGWFFCLSRCVFLSFQVSFC